MAKKTKMTLNFVSNKKRDPLKTNFTSIAGDKEPYNVEYPEQEVETITYFPKKTINQAIRVLLLLSVFLFGSCGKSEPEPLPKADVTVSSEKTEVLKGQYITYVRELEYKGHLYVVCDVHGGMSLAHAGHCWCNPFRDAKKP
jgi:hypothetical protein